jgi:hypothetical protein
MSEFSRARRRLLLSTAAWVGGVAALGATRPAGAAMQAEPLSPQSNLGLAVANRCGPSSDHAALKAQLEAELAANPSLATLTAKCPICGCPVVVSR